MTSHFKFPKIIKIKKIDSTVTTKDFVVWIILLNRGRHSRFKMAKISMFPNLSITLSVTEILGFLLLFDFYLTSDTPVCAVVMTGQCRRGCAYRRGLLGK